MGMKVVGTWHLEKFEIEDPAGHRRPWGHGAHGTLIYSPDGHMSVSINRRVENKSNNESKDTMDSILFYSGTYAVEGATVVHQVTQASDPNRIGKSLLRHAELTGDTLSLRSPGEAFGTAHLKWKRISK